MRPTVETITIEVPIPQQQYALLTRLAEEQEKSVAELLEELATEFVEAAQAQSADDQTLATAQARYPGEYVALWRGQILTHADRATTVFQMVRDQFGLTGTDVLLVKMEPPDLQIRHPRLDG